jgi:hypothetical protein
MRMHPRDVPQQCLVEVLLGLQLEAADALRQQVDPIVSHFHGTCVEKAGHESMPDQVGMRPHVDGARTAGPAFQGLEGVARDRGARLWPITGSAAA